MEDYPAGENVPAPLDPGEEGNSTPSTAPASLDQRLGVAIKVVTLLLLFVVTFHVTKSVTTRGYLFSIGGIPSSLYVDFIGTQRLDLSGHVTGR